MEKHPLHFKIKRNILTKFLSEPVDALDLRLTKAETLLDGNLVDDPWKAGLMFLPAKINKHQPVV